MINKVYLLTVTMMLLLPFNSDSRELGEIYDAVFSPDGKYIGVGTSEGLYVFEKGSMTQVKNMEMNEGVHFLKWSPDQKRILLAYWPNDQLKPTPRYSLWNLDHGTLEYTFEESVRWLRSAVHLDQPPASIAEQKFPSRNLMHHNSIIFSPDGYRLAWVDYENQITIVDISGGDFAAETFSPIPYHISSIVFSDDGKRIWCGTLSEIRSDKITSSRLICLDAASLIILKDIILDESPFPVVTAPIEVSKDEKYAIISWNFPDYVSVCGNLHHWLYDIKEHTSIASIAGSRLKEGPLSFITNYREYFVYDDNVIKILCTSCVWCGTVYWNSRELDLSSMKMTKDKQMIGGITQSFLLQPFSPDGKQFLHIDNGKLFLYDTDTLHIQQLLPKPSAVDEFERIHENG